MQLTLNGQPVRQRMVAPAELQAASFAPATAEGGAAGAGAPGSAQPPEGMLAELVSWGMLCEGRNELRCARACTRGPAPGGLHLGAPHPRAPPPRSPPAPHPHLAPRESHLLRTPAPQRASPSAGTP